MIEQFIKTYGKQLDNTFIYTKIKRKIINK